MESGQLLSPSLTGSLCKGVPKEKGLDPGYFLAAYSGV